MERSFIVHTPLGKLRVYAKHDVDCAEDYPGVYIELIKNETDKYGEMLCCVEYDPISKNLQTLVYQPYVDEPVELVVHEIERNNMETITIDKKALIKQLRFDLDMIHTFDGHRRDAIESLAENISSGSVDSALQSLRWNQHCKEMYRHHIVAVLELIGVFDENRGDTSDVDVLRQKVDELESA